MPPCCPPPPSRTPMIEVISTTRVGKMFLLKVYWNLEPYTIFMGIRPWTGQLHNEIQHAAILVPKL